MTGIIVAIWVVVLTKLGTRLVKKHRARLTKVVFAVRKDRGSRLVTELPPMATPEELAILEVPAFLRAEKAKEALHAVHEGKAATLAEAREKLAEPEVVAQEVEVLPAATGKKAAKKKDLPEDEAAPSLQEVTAEEWEASILLPVVPAATK